MDGKLHLRCLGRLADVLWYERRLMEFLLFKLVAANLMLEADEQRFIGPALAEVERVIAEIRSTEEERAELIAELAELEGTDPAAITLAHLALEAPEELRSVFEDHRARFLELTGEIEAVTRENRRLATLGLGGIRATFGMLEGPTTAPTRYDAAGRPREDRLPVPPARIDEVL
ncbi:MAG TPA: flagellar protein FlgN [Actinobacteria bacterium]|nr:flagellar protein FlgN [Actinomycetota bacterium]